MFYPCSLTIGYNFSLTSLSGLDQLTNVQDLYIGYNPLTSLAGLDYLTSVGQDLDIAENTFLASLTGLGSLDRDNWGK